MDKQFLSVINLDILYNNIKQNVKNSIGYDLNSNTQYRTRLIPKLAEQVLKNNKYRSSDLTTLNEAFLSRTSLKTLFNSASKFM